MWISRSIVPCSMLATFRNVWLRITIRRPDGMRNHEFRERRAGTGASVMG